MSSTSLPLDPLALSLPVAAREELFLVAGEASGDLLGSLLIKSLKQELPKLPLVGVGGPKMVEAGLLSIGYYEKLQVMGFWETLKNLATLLSTLHFVTQEILKRQPKAVLMIDFPGFNLRLAKRLRRAGYRGKLFHFVSPTIWAWRKGRIETLASSLDLLFTIFPFEKEHYRGTPLQVEYVGHPLQELLQKTQYDPDFEERFGIDPRRPLLALFPGSREGELSRNLPSIVSNVRAFLKLHPNYQVAFSMARPRFSSILKREVKGDFPFVEIPPSHTYDLMKRAGGALAKSGTVTLELAWHEVPTAVIYMLSPFDRFLAKWWFNLNLPFYCIVNILAKRELFPEWIKEGAPEESVVPSLEALLGPKREEVQTGCEEVWRSLSPPGHLPPTLQAARKIRQVLCQSP